MQQSHSDLSSIHNHALIQSHDQITFHYSNALTIPWNMTLIPSRGYGPRAVFYNPVVTRKLNGWHPSIDSHPPDIRFPSTNTLSFWGITEKSIIRMVIYLGIIGHRKVTHKKGHVTGGSLLGLLNWYLLLIMKPQKAFKIIYRVGTYIYTHTHTHTHIYIYILWLRSIHSF